MSRQSDSHLARQQYAAEAEMPPRLEHPIGTVASANASIPDKEAKAVQWFTADISRTDDGCLVANVHYRAGVKLGREVPVDAVLTAGDAVRLIDLMKRQDITRFAHGWGNGGRPAMISSRDFTKQHASVMEHARRQLDDLAERVGVLLVQASAPVSVA